MAKADAGPMPGMRDMLAEQMIPRLKIINSIRAVYESYGFVPLDTPGIEKLETLKGKYGAEGEKLMYKFKDHGKRDIALRYDLTVPLARVAMQHKSRIPMPYKRYQIGQVWRGESPQAGRYREFTQFDIDTVGAKGAISDAEVATAIYDAFHSLGVNVIVKINNRRLLDALVEKAGLSKEKDLRDFISTIDKINKIGLKNVLIEIKKIGGTKAEKAAKDYLSVSGSSKQRTKAIKKSLGDSQAAIEGADNLEQVFTIIEKAGYPRKSIEFDQSIARGMDYYTGIIYEAILVDLPKLGSVCGGGRYDNLVKKLGGPDLPAVGVSIGIDRLFEGLRQLEKLDTPKTNTQVLIANYSNDLSGLYMQIARNLRSSGVPTEIFYDPNVKTGKQIQFADKQGIKYVVFLKPEDVKSEKAAVKNIITGKQKVIKIDKLPAFLTKN